LGSPPDRQRLKQKSPAEFQKFIDQAAALSPVGLASAYRGVVKPRSPIYSLKDDVASLKKPTLIVVGQLDTPCLKPSQFLADTIPGARLEALPATGHSVNVEEPTIINRLVVDFVGTARAELSGFVRGSFRALAPFTRMRATDQSSISLRPFTAAAHQ
jgi:pimeloyl-ACP methyl ester carboxylesterase